MTSAVNPTRIRSPGLLRTISTVVIDLAVRDGFGQLDAALRRLE